MRAKQICCPYCGSTAILKDTSFIHGRSASGQVYVCSKYPACDSYVGVKSGTKLPLGTLANRELRQKRIQTHHIFDQLWKRKIFTRSQAYLWASDRLGLPMQETHIGRFSTYMCDQLAAESLKVLGNHHIPMRAAVG